MLSQPHLPRAHPGKQSNPLELSPTALATLIEPLSSADDALARLDERLRVSPVRDGVITRADFAEACAALWIEGELVHLEDLVLHDAGMDVRTPTHQIVRAHAYLRLRRKSAQRDPINLLSPPGILQLAGRTAPVGDQDGLADRAGGLDDADPSELDLKQDRDAVDGVAEEPAASPASTAALALLRRIHPTRSAAASKDSLVYDENWDESARLAAWSAGLEAADRFPPLLGALGLALAWRDEEPLQRQAWLAPLFAGLYLRRRGRTKAHLLGFTLGLRSLRPAPGRAGTTVERLRQGLAIVEAGARETLAQHDQLMLAGEILARKCRGRRENSHLPHLAELLLAAPLVSVPMIAQNLAISPQAAQILVADFGTALREITGRKRYRAWTIG